MTSHIQTILPPIGMASCALVLTSSTGQLINVFAAPAIAPATNSGVCSLAYSKVANCMLSAGQYSFKLVR